MLHMLRFNWMHSTVELSFVLHMIALLKRPDSNSLVSCWTTVLIYLQYVHVISDFNNSQIYFNITCNRNEAVAASQVRTVKGLFTLNLKFGTFIFFWCLHIITKYFLYTLYGHLKVSEKYDKCPRVSSSLKGKSLFTSSWRECATS